jgi:C-terminal processing protease CtpA/Prc
MRSPTSEASLMTSIRRWRAARRIILGSIVLAGAMATSAALMYRYGGATCQKAAQHRVAERGYTYSGIGAVIQARGDSVVVRSTLAGAPADGVLREGNRLISVDGTYPESIEGWANALRGPEGTSVTIEVASKCSGHKYVTLERKLIHVTRE